MKMEIAELKEKLKRPYLQYPEIEGGISDLRRLSNIFDTVLDDIARQRLTNDGAWSPSIDKLTNGAVVLRLTEAQFESPFFLVQQMQRVVDELSEKWEMMINDFIKVR